MSNENLELFDLDSGDLDQFDKDVGDLQVISYFPPGKYAWNIKSAKKNVKVDEKTGQERKDINILFEMKECIKLSNEEEDKEELPEVGSLMSFFIPNPVLPPDSSANFPYRKFRFMMNKLLGKENLVGRNIDQQLELLVGMFHSDYHVTFSTKDNVYDNPKTGMKETRSQPAEDFEAVEG